MPHSTLDSLRDCCRSTARAAWGSVSVEADGKCLCCSVLGGALGKCQFVVDTSLPRVAGKLEHVIAPFKGTGPPLPLCPLGVHLFLLETASLLWMSSVGISIRHRPTCLDPPQEKILLINSPGPAQWTQGPSAMLCQAVTWYMGTWKRFLPWKAV